MSLPTKAKVVIIGGGIHGLSTAWKLSETYKNPGDVVVLEKKDTAAGASGIACGVVRNNYFQPAMRELMAHSVSVWESDPKAFKYNPVGYMQISPEVMHAYKYKENLTVEELKTKLFKTSRPKSALMINEACEKGFFYLEKTSNDQRKKHIKPSESFISEFNSYLETLKNLSF